MAAQPLVSILIGSSSDADTITGCRQLLAQLGIPHEAKVLSAHRTPEALRDYVAELPARGVRIVIAAAGMSAHLAGVVAAQTDLPVLGVPVASGPLQGVDALLSTSQMPPGVPVGCLGIGAAGAKNAAWLAARILALADKKLTARMRAEQEKMRAQVLQATLPEVTA